MAGWTSLGCSRLNPMAAPLLLTVTHRRFLVHQSLSAPPCVAALVCAVARLTQRAGLSNAGADGPAPSCLWFPMTSSKRTSHIAEKTRLEGLPFSEGQSPDAGKPHILPPSLSRCPCHPRGASLPTAARGLLALRFCCPGVEGFFWNRSQGRAQRGAVPGA